MHFKTGDTVEVRSDEEGFVGVWYAAEIVHIADARSCVVEFEQLVDEDGHPLQESALLKNVRPPAPPLAKTTWLRGDPVEAYDRDGWWAGVISEVLAKDTFLVYFRLTAEEIGFPSSRLRCPQSWQDGKWTRAGREESSAQQQALAVSSSDLKSTPPLAPKKRGRKRKDANGGSARGNSREKPESMERAIVGLPMAESPSPPPEKVSMPSSKMDRGQKLGGKPGTLGCLQDNPQNKGFERHVQPIAKKQRLELTAYRWLIQALYLRGPLNWEQEELLTQARCHLEISNTEHAILLTEIMAAFGKK